MDEPRQNPHLLLEVESAPGRRVIHAGTDLDERTGVLSLDDRQLLVADRRTRDHHDLAAVDGHGLVPDLRRVVHLKRDRSAARRS